ncbi:Zim17p [Rhodotorula paludigena]|uniref:Zim17p n=1 Tax=Rhodotorula paludigena TaxID=86838 RepID=UPI00316E31C0
MSLVHSALRRAPSLLPLLRTPTPRLVSASVSHASWLPRPRALHASPLRLDQPPSRGTPIGRVDRRLRITFTCTAPSSSEEEGAGQQCGHRSTHEFSRRSYEKGVVIVQCPGCDNRHLIADHLHWFSQTPSPASPLGQAIGSERARTVEDLMRERGEEVRWGSLGEGEAAAEGVKWVLREREEGDGGKTVEVVPEDEGAEQAAAGEVKV